MNESQIRGMRDFAYTMTGERTERGPRRPADGHEAAYVLGLAHFAEGIESDGVTLYWSEKGTSAEFSTQAPTYRILVGGVVMMFGLSRQRAQDFAAYYRDPVIMPG